MQYKLILPALIIALTGVTLFGVAGVGAQGATDPHSSLIQKFVQKFGLKEADVKAVFDEVKTEHHAQMRVRMEERLNQAVQEGKLTEAQKQAAISKFNELQTKHEENREQFKAMTPEERRQAMENRRQELETWAKQNGIDLSYLKGGMKGEWKHW